MGRGARNIESAAAAPRGSRRKLSLEVSLAPFDGRVEVSASERDGVIVVHMLRTVGENRGTGQATAALRAICDHADRTGQTVALTPEPVTRDGEKRGLSKTALTAWYRKHGFVPNRGTGRDWRVRETLIRPPQDQ